MESMNIVIIGHVDHGKSTLVGRLLCDTGSLPEGKLESIKKLCESTSKVFEYAFLLDALDNERGQGITIDMARCFFQTKKRRYMILDAPGHVEFLKNMVTGASRAEAAILLIDAKEGVRENSRRHGLLASMLGIRQLIVAINKMDLVDYKKEIFERIRTEYTEYLKGVGITPLGFVPIAALLGENLAQRSEKLSWYTGPTILEFLDELHKEDEATRKSFRMPLQDIYKFTSHGDQKRIFAGRVESGQLHVGDEVIFLPSQKTSKVASIEFFGKDGCQDLQAGQSAGFALEEQVYVQRGELICKTSESLAQVSSRLRVNLFWMGKRPMRKDQRYWLKTGTAKVECQVSEILHILDSQETGKKFSKSQIDRHDVAELILDLKKPVAIDMNSDIDATGRFVIVDNYEISGGGIVREAMNNEADQLRSETLTREMNFVRGAIDPAERVERYGQKPTLLVFTGTEPEIYKKAAKEVEAALFRRGRAVYFLGMGTIKYGLDLDLTDNRDARPEHIRRLGELAYLFLDAGLITLVTARDLSKSELETLDALTGDHAMLTISFASPRERQNEIFIKNEDELPLMTAQVLEWLALQGRILTLQ